MTATKFGAPDIAGAKKAEAERPSTFIATADLVNRHLIIVCKSIETKQGERGDFESITADVIVLDGRKTDKIPKLPHIERGKFLGGFFVIEELRKYVPGSGDPAAGQPVLVYLVLAGKAFKFEDAEDGLADAATTQDAWRQYENGQRQTSEPPF